MGRRRTLLVVLLTLAVNSLVGVPGTTAATQAGTRSFDFHLDLTDVRPDDQFVIEVDEAGNHRVGIVAGPIDGPGDGCPTISVQPLASCTAVLGLHHGNNPRGLGATGPVLVLFAPGGAHTIVNWSNNTQHRIDCSWNPVGAGLSQVHVNGGCTNNLLTHSATGSVGTLHGIQDVCWSCAQPQQNGVIHHYFWSSPL